MAPAKPIPSKLRPLFAPMRYKVLKGGRLGMKSHTFSELVIERALGSIPDYPPPPVRICCLREVQTSIRDSVRQLIIDKLLEAGKEDECDLRDQELRFHNGSLVIFKGLQSYNASNIKSLEGYDVAWVEEAQTISHLSLRMLRPTIRKQGSELWFSYNPRYSTDAIDEFVTRTRPANAIVVETSWRDNPFISDEMIAEIEHDYEMDPLLADHVWGGGYEVVTKGSYYGSQIAAAGLDFRITEVGYDPALPVYAAMDLGIGDATAIWIFQLVGTEWHFLKFYENSGQSLEHYTGYLKSLRWPVDAVLLPPDAAARELQSGKSRDFFVQNQGFTTYLLEKHLVEDGIAAVRQTLPRCWFDRDGTGEGLEKLRRYRSEFNDHTGVFKLKPLHDDNSHGADAFRYAVMGESLLGGWGPNKTSHAFQRSDWSKKIETVNPYIPHQARIPEPVTLDRWRHLMADLFTGNGSSPDIPAGYQDRISVIDQFEDALHRPVNTEHATSKPLKPLSSEAVQSSVRQAVDAALDFQGSYVTERRLLADKYYQGLVPELTDIPDRSQIKITAVRDAVKAVTASLARIFTQTDKVGEFYSDDEEDERMCADASTFINSIFWRFGGYRALVQMGTDALKSMIGVVKVAVIDVPYTVHQSMSLPPEGQPMPPPPPGTAITEMNDTEVVLTQTKTRKSWEIEAVPPEEFLIDPEATSIENARLVAHRRSIYLYQAVEMGFEPEAVLPFGTNETDPGSSATSSIEKTERRGYSSLDEGIASADPMSRKMLMTECYLRIDADGDGFAELRRIVCGGETYRIISDEPVNYRPFAVASADLQPHVFFPICMAEDLMQDQLAQTALMRSIIDNAAFVNQPRTEVNENMVNINDVKNSGIGAIVRVKQIGQINELVTPFVAGQTLPVLQYLADVSQSRSGVTKLSQGLDPDQLQSTTRVAAQAAVSAADARIEMMARNIGETGVASLFIVMLKTAIFNLQGMQSIKVPQGFQQVRPEWWHDQVGVKVNVGLGSGQIDEKKQLLGALLEKQMAIVAQYGPANPVCGWTNVQETLRTLMRLSGIRNTQDYFPFVPPEAVQKLDEQQKQQSQEAQKVQMETMKAQMQLQKQQADAATFLAQAENKKAELKYQADIQKMKTGYFADAQKLQAQISQMKTQAMSGLSKDLLVDDRERDKMQLQFIADMEKVGAQLEQIKQAAAQAQQQSEESKTT